LTTSPDITADLISAAVAEIAEQRAVIDQAKGMLTLLYGVDDEAAFDMLRARSQNTNITVRTLAEQLVADYRALVNEEALYEALMSVHERIVATDRT
jgi:ANTAR domain-containing protein